MSEVKEAKVAVTASELKDILSAVIAEARKPVNTEEQIRADQEKAQARAELAETLKQKVANELAFQRDCNHCQNDGKAAGATATVYVQGGGYLLCQRCQSVLRPSENPATYQKHFQMQGLPG
jgi:RNA-splicing ligase RtcB